MAEYARVGDPKYLGAYIKPEELIIIGDVALVGGPTKVEVADIMSGQVVPFYRINDNVISPTKYNTSVTIDVIFSAPLIEEPNQTLDRMLDSETLDIFPHQKHLYVDFHHFYSLLKLFPIVPVYGERLNQLVSGSWVDDSVRMYQIDMVQVNTLPNTSGQLQVKLIMSPVQQSYDQRDQLSIMYRDGFNTSKLTQKSYFFDSDDIRTQIQNDVNERINRTKYIIDNGVKSAEQTTIQNLAKSMKLVFDINYIIATLYMQAKWQLGLEFNGDQLTKDQQLHYSKVGISAFRNGQNGNKNFTYLSNAFDKIQDQINNYIKNNLPSSIKEQLHKEEAKEAAKKETNDTTTNNKLKNISDLFSVDITNNRSVHITSVQVQYDNQVVGYNTHQDRTIRQYMGSNRERGTMHLIVQNDEDGREFIDSIQSLRNLSQSIVSQQQGMVNQQPLLVRGILNIFGITNIYITNFQVSTLDDMPNQFSCMLQFVSTSGNVMHSEQREVNHQFAAFKKQQMNQQLNQIRSNNKVAYYTLNSSGFIYRTKKPLFDENGKIDQSIVQLINSSSAGGQNVAGTIMKLSVPASYEEFRKTREYINESVKKQILEPVDKEAYRLDDKNKAQQLSKVAADLVNSYKNYIQEHYTITAIQFDYMIHYKQFTSQLMTALLQLYLHQNLLAQNKGSNAIQNDPGKVINKIIEWSKQISDSAKSGSTTTGQNTQGTNQNDKNTNNTQNKHDSELDSQVTFLNDIISIIQEKYTTRNLRHFHASIITGIRMLFYHQSLSKSVNKTGGMLPIDYTLNYGPLKVITDQYEVTNGLYDVFDGKSIWQKLGDAWDQMLKALPALMMQPTIGMNYVPYPAGCNWLDSIEVDIKSSSQYNLSLQYIVALFYINGGQFAVNIDQQLVTENQFSQSLISNYGDILFSDYAKKIWLMQPAQGSNNVRVKDLLYSKSKLTTRNYSDAVQNLKDTHKVNVSYINSAKYKGVQLDVIKKRNPELNDIGTPQFNRTVMANQVSEMYKMIHSFGTDVENLSNKLNEFIIEYMNLGNWLDANSPAYYIYNLVYGQKSMINKQGNILTKLMFNAGSGFQKNANFTILVQQAVRMQFYNQETDSIVDIMKGQLTDTSRMILSDAQQLYGDIQKQFELYMLTTKDSDFIAKVGKDNYSFQSDLFNWLCKQDNDGKQLILSFCTNFSSFYYQITDAQYNNNSQRIDLLRHYSQLDDFFNYMHDILQFVDLQESNFLSTFNLQLVQSGFLSPWDLNYRLPTEPRDLFIGKQNAGMFDDFYLQNEDQTQNLQVMKFVGNYINSLSTNMQQFTSKSSSDQQQLSDLFTIESTQQSLLTGDGQYQKDKENSNSSNKSIYEKMQSVEKTYNSMVQNQGTENQYVNLGFNQQATNTPYIPSETSVKQLLQDPMYRQEIMQSQNQHDPTVDDQLTKFEFSKLMENYMKFNRNSNYITRQNDLFLSSLKSSSTVEIGNGQNRRNNIQLHEYSQEIYMQTYILKRLIEDTTRRLSMQPQQCIIFNLKRGSSTNYEFRQYVYYQVEDVAVMREQDNPIDSQVVKLYSMLDYSGERFVDNNYVAVGQDTKEMPIGQLLKPGVDIEIRMGYSKNVAELTKVFVGYIRDVQSQNGEQEFIAEGYGQQLAKPIYKKPELYTGFFNTPKDRVVDQIKRVGQPELGLSQAQDISEKLFQYIMPRIDDAQNIRSQFSWLQYRQYLPAYDNVYNPSDYYTTLQTGSSSVWSVPKDYFQNFEHHFEHYTAQQGYSAWDVIEDQQLASPDYICQVEPLEDVAAAQRVFFGKAHYPFKYCYFQAQGRAAGKIQSTWADVQSDNTATSESIDINGNLSIYMNSRSSDDNNTTSDNVVVSSTEVLDIDKKSYFALTKPFEEDQFVSIPGFAAFIPNWQNYIVSRTMELSEPYSLYMQYLLNNWNQLLGIGSNGVVLSSPHTPYEPQYLKNNVPGLTYDDLERYNLQQLDNSNSNAFSFVFMPRNQDSSDWKLQVDQNNVQDFNGKAYNIYRSKSGAADVSDISNLGFINQTKQIMYGSSLSYDKVNNRLNLIEDVLQIDILGDQKVDYKIKDPDGKIQVKTITQRVCLLQVGFAFIDKNIYAGQPIVIDLSSKYRKYLVLLPRTIQYQSKRDSKGIGTDVNYVKLAHGLQLLQQLNGKSTNPVNFRIRHLWQETDNDTIILNGGKITAQQEYNKQYDQKYPIDQTVADSNVKSYTIDGKTYKYSKVHDVNWYKLTYMKSPKTNTMDLILNQVHQKPIDVTVSGEQAIVRGYFSEDFQLLADVVLNNYIAGATINDGQLGYIKLFSAIDGVDVKFDRQKIKQPQYKSYSFADIQKINEAIGSKYRPKLRIIGKGRLRFGYQPVQNINTREFIVNQQASTGGKLIIKQERNSDNNSYKLLTYVEQHQLDVYTHRVAEYFSNMFDEVISYNQNGTIRENAVYKFLHMYGILQIHQQQNLGQLLSTEGGKQNTSLQTTSWLNPFSTNYQTLEQIYTIYLADIYATNQNQSILQENIQKYVLGKWSFADGSKANITSNTYSTGITSSKKITGRLQSRNGGINQQNYQDFISQCMQQYSKVHQQINGRVLGQPAQQSATPGINDLLSTRLITESLVNLNDTTLRDQIWANLSINIMSFGLSGMLLATDQKKVSYANQIINTNDNTLKSSISQLLTKYYQQLKDLIMVKGQTGYINQSTPKKSHLQLDKNLYEIQSFDYQAHNGELNNVSAFTYYYQLKSFIMPQLGNAAHIKYLMEKLFDQYEFDQATGALKYGVRNEYSISISNSKMMQTSQNLWHVWITGDPITPYPKLVPIHLLRFSTSLYNDGTQKIDFTTKPNNINQLGLTQSLSYEEVINHIRSNILSHGSLETLIKVESKESFSAFAGVVNDNLNKLSNIKLNDQTISSYRNISNWISDFERYYNSLGSNQQINGKQLQTNQPGKTKSFYSLFADIYNSNKVIEKQILKQYIDSDILDNLQYIVNMTNNSVIDFFPQLYKSGFGFVQQRSFNLSSVTAQPFQREQMPTKSPSIFNWLDELYLTNCLLKSTATLNYPVHISNFVRRSFINPQLQMQPDVQTDLQFQLSGVLFFIPSQLVAYIATNSDIVKLDNQALYNKVYEQQLNQYKLLNVFLQVQRVCAAYIEQLGKYDAIGINIINYLYIRACFANQIINFQSYQMLTDVELSMSRVEMDKFIANQNKQLKLGNNNQASIFNFVTINNDGYNKVKKQYNDQKLSDNRGIWNLKKPGQQSFQNSYIQLCNFPKLNGTQVKFQSWYPYWDDQFGFTICLGGPLHNTGINYQFIATKYAEYMNTMLSTLSTNINKVIQQNVNDNFFRTDQNYRFTATKQLIDSMIQSFN